MSIVCYTCRYVRHMIYLMKTIKHIDNPYADSGLAHSFEEYFQVILADTPELRETVYRLRYQVYCHELHFERKEDFPNKQEFDEFDSRSRHCLILHKKTNRYAGCVRLVMADPEDPNAPLPFEKFCGNAINHENFDPSKISRMKVGEISRLAVIGDFRKRQGEKKSPYGIAPSNHITDEPRRQFPSIPIGLYLAITSVGLAEDLDGVFAMMEPRLARHLRHFGIIFKQIGPIIDYHGSRAPFYIDRDALYSNIKPEIRGLLDFLNTNLQMNHR